MHYKFTLSKGVRAVEWWIWQLDCYIILSYKASECRRSCLSVGDAGVFVLFWVVYEMNVAKELNSYSIVSGECGLITRARENMSCLGQISLSHFHYMKACKFPAIRPGVHMKSKLRLPFSKKLKMLRCSWNAVYS